MFECPCCGGEISFLKKMLLLPCGGTTQCPSCGNKLCLKPYGTSRSDIGLIFILTYYFLNIEKWFVPICILELLVFSLIKSILLPLVPCDTKQKMSFIDWFVAVFLILGLLIGLLNEIFQ